jgi:hypothetical protein
MSARASYRKLDFVDYFKALTQTQDKWIEEFVGDRTRLALLEAFATDRVTLGRALDFLLSEFPKSKLGWAMEQCLRQSARRYFLPKEDPRHITISDDVRKGYTGILEGALKGAKDNFWFAGGGGTSGSFSSREEAGRLCCSIRRDEERQYVDYWKIANWEEYGALLTNRPLLAKIDAFNRRLDSMEPHDHVADIWNFAASCLPSLQTSLRSLVFAHLSRDIQFGIVEIPTDLQADFPQIYAERGIF